MRSAEQPKVLETGLAALAEWLVVVDLEKLARLAPPAVPVDERASTLVALPDRPPNGRRHVA